MELLYADPYYGTESEGTVDFIDELRAELTGFDESLELYETDLGLGADFPAIIAHLFRNIDWPVLTTSGAVATFFLGEKILKNIEAWHQIGLKLKRLFAARRPTFIDANSAITLVFSEIEDLVPTDIVEVHCQVIFGTPVPHGTGKLGQNPYAGLAPLRWTVNGLGPKHCLTISCSRN